jgi:hypothetical protein
MATKHESSMANRARPTDQNASEAAPTATLPDAVVQIREARDRIVAAVIARAEKEGSYQHAKWLFEWGGLVPSGHGAPEDEPSFIRLLLEQLQIPETPEELAAEFSANNRAVE